MIVRTLLLAFAAYCTITVSAQNHTTGNPANPTDYGYLKDYLPLKDYIDYEKYPNFKLGLAVGANDYLNNSTVQAVVNGYFTETVTGNAMKMSSVVSNDGTMNFSTVTNFVNAATNAGVDVFGHTLAWHAQQPTGYLNGLIKRSEEHTSELQSRPHLVCRLLLESYRPYHDLHSFPTRRSSDLHRDRNRQRNEDVKCC